ncbi:DUF6691 family protein [Legionella impletisoli]|uniref:Transporter n=1 Tax=Legionella impletisoli TaxID=343510 RepID=A0A917JQV7_9GAMM|nr:DUF6691 family protein [Legionella impletisoli]GGI81892.1 transporter [Legionella impletisoli]
MYTFMAFLCGLIFGLGLTVSNMTNPNKVLNFLDVFGPWDPTLLVVLVAAVIVAFLGYFFIQGLKKPILDQMFHLPEETKITKRLVLGSACFGVGWGIAGYCPGPGITALSTFNADPLYFVVGLIIGSCFYSILYSGRT